MQPFSFANDTLPTHGCFSKDLYVMSIYGLFLAFVDGGTIIKCRF